MRGARQQSVCGHIHGVYDLAVKILVITLRLGGRGPRGAVVSPLARVAAASERLLAICVRRSSVGPCPGQCPAATLPPIPAASARNRPIGSRADGLPCAEGRIAHSSAADPTS